MYNGAYAKYRLFPLHLIYQHIGLIINWFVVFKLFKFVIIVHKFVQLIFSTYNKWINIYDPEPYFVEIAPTYNCYVDNHRISH